MQYQIYIMEFGNFHKFMPLIILLSFGWEKIEIPIHFDYGDVDFLLNHSPPYFINDKRFIENIHDLQTALFTWIYPKSIKVEFHIHDI